MKTLEIESSEIASLIRSLLVSLYETDRCVPLKTTSSSPKIGLNMKTLDYVLYILIHMILLEIIIKAGVHYYSVILKKKKIEIII